MPSDWKEHRN